MNHVENLQPYFKFDQFDRLLAEFEQADIVFAASVFRNVDVPQIEKKPKDVIARFILTPIAPQEYIYTQESLNIFMGEMQTLIGSTITGELSEPTLFQEQRSTVNMGRIAINHPIVKETIATEFTVLDDVSALRLDLQKMKASRIIREQYVFIVLPDATSVKAYGTYLSELQEGLYSDVPDAVAEMNRLLHFMTQEEFVHMQQGENPFERELANVRERASIERERVELRRKLHAKE